MWCQMNRENNENKNIARDENCGILVLHSSNCCCCSGSSDPTRNQQMLSLKTTLKEILNEKRVGMVLSIACHPLDWFDFGSASLK